MLMHARRVGAAAVAQILEEGLRLNPRTSYPHRRVISYACKARRPHLVAAEVAQLLEEGLRPGGARARRQRPHRRHVLCGREEKGREVGREGRSVSVPCRRIEDGVSTDATSSAPREEERGGAAADISARPKNGRSRQMATEAI